MYVRDDAGDLRKYRTELPNLIDDMELDVYSFRLYCHLKRVAGASPQGRCFQSTATMAAHCKMSVGKVSEAKQDLAQRGLICIKEGNRGNHVSDEITIVDIWPKNFAHFAEEPSASQLPATPLTPSPHEPAPSPHEPAPSPHEPAPSPGEPAGSPHEYKKEPIKKEPIKKEPSKKSRDATHPLTKPIVDRYCQCLGYVPARSKMARVGADAKDIASRGYSPDEVEQCYHILEDDPYWQDKTITLPVILARLEKTKATMRNGRNTHHDRPLQSTQEPQGYTGGWTPELLAEARAAKARGDTKALTAIIRGSDV